MDSSRPIRANLHGEMVFGLDRIQKRKKQQEKHRNQHEKHKKQHEKKTHKNHKQHTLRIELSGRQCEIQRAACNLSKLDRKRAAV